MGRAAAAAGFTALVAALALTGMGARTTAGASDPPPTAAEPDRPTIRAVFLADCAVCHGADARGTYKGPSLAGVGEASVYYMVASGNMPLATPSKTPKPHRPPRYTRRQVRELVDYVQALTGNRGPALPTVDLARADLSEGGRLYGLNCAACHAATGVGGALLHREAPPVFKAPPLEAAAAVRTGPAAMPAFGEAALSRSELNDVVAYARYLEAPRNEGGAPLGGIGPVAEGAVAIVVGLGVLVLVIRWIGTGVKGAGPGEASS